MTFFTSKNEVFESSVDDYDATYTIVKKIMKIIGLRTTLKDTKFESFCWNLYFWFIYANVAVAVILETIDLIKIAEGGAFLDVFKMMPCVGYLIVALVKSIKIKIYRSVFENLVNEMRGMWPKGPISEDKHLLLTKTLKNLKLLLRAYYSCNMVLCSIFTLPVLFAYTKRLLGSDVHLILPFTYWLPFDPYDNNTNFLIALIPMICHCFQSALLMLSGDLLLITFLGHITLQFDLLTVRVNKLFKVPIDGQLIESYPLGEITKKLQVKRNQDKSSPDDDNNSDKDLENKIEKELISIIRRHRALIRLSGDIENMYTFSMLVNFMNSSVIICFCLLCIAFVEKWNGFNYKLFFVTAISQTWILCWYGQRLMDTSTGVGEALYNCGWYVAPLKLKKAILIMIQRSQNEVHITTYGFSTISLASYATILKTSWSYFTLLINMYNE